MILFAMLIAGSFSLGGMAAPFIEPAALNFVRFAIAMLIMGTATLIMTGKIPLPGMALWKLTLLGALFATYFVLMFRALQISSPVSTGAVFTLIPFMSAVFGYLFLRQRTSLHVILSLLFAAVGAIWVIFRGDLNSMIALRIGKGELIYLVGCACHAAYAPLVKRFAPPIALVAFSFWTLTATCFWIGLYGAPDLAITDWKALPGIVWITIAYTSIFTTALTVFLLQFSAMHLSAAKVMAYGYLTPVFIIILEGILGHGWTSFSVSIGALITVCGLLVLALTREN